MLCFDDLNENVMISIKFQCTCVNTISTGALRILSLEVTAFLTRNILNMSKFWQKQFVH